MIQNGLQKLKPDSRDYSVLRTFGAVAPKPEGLPESYSIYDGREVPDQNSIDRRFKPALPAMPFGCTGETGAFESGIQDGKLYNPQDLYERTPGIKGQGRDMRELFKTMVARGLLDNKGNIGEKRRAYFNCYGTGKIDDFDAARIALWINQGEKRGVYVGSWWYPEFNEPENDVLPLPSFNLKYGSLHCYLVSGWRTRRGVVELEVIPWIGKGYGNKGRVYVKREIYNALMSQPWTGAFTITKWGADAPVPVGYRAILDHLVYFLRSISFL